jgi:hypothetical protein
MKFVGGTVITVMLVAAIALAAASSARGDTSSAVAKPASRSIQEARFLRTVDRQRTANLVTGDLTYYAGSHVDYTCDVDVIVRSGVILGQCGSDAEPIDLFVKLPTAHLRVGDRLRVLGIMEPPATWADVMGHTVYYAFVRAIFVDQLPKETHRNASASL